MITSCGAISPDTLQSLLERYQLNISWVEPGETIPGSFWGEPEAGLIADRIYLRADTPLHSMLHETCHYICMDKHRRTGLHTNAMGDYAEENAVCYLQLLLAEFIPGIDRYSQMREMDHWGYSFRLGSARAWFERDADDARLWLLRHRLISTHSQPTWRLRKK